MSGAGRVQAAAVSTLALALLAGCATQRSDQEPAARPSALIRLWQEGVPAFGVFVPNERAPGERAQDGSRLPPLYTAEGGAELARNALYDFVFLNLEGGYDAAAVAAIAAGLSTPGAIGDKALLVRIPPIERDGPERARARVRASLRAGADGVILPHVRSVEEARLAVGFFEAAGAEVWSPANPEGEIIAMIMIEDAGALAAVEEIADTRGYSVLACGIGSLTRALGGDREAAEAGNQEVLAHAKRVGVPDMITANTGDVACRVEEGFLALLMSGAEADEAIRVGRAAAGR